MTQDWTQRFPILGRTTYLASHTLGAVPAATKQALADYHREWDELGIRAWSGPWWETVLDFSARLERLLGAPAGTVVHMQNATRAMAAVASCFDYQGERNRVVLTDLEFTTFYPFWGAQQRLGAELVVVESDDGVTVDPERIADAVDDRTLLVATCHAYFRSGALQDLGPIVKAAKQAGAYTLIDGYQVVGAVPVDVGSLGVDFYVGGSHKYLSGGPGAGYLYVREGLIPDLRPRLTGWFGMEDPFAFVRDTTGDTLNEGVFRFLDGTPNVPAMVAAREGLKVVETVGLDTIRRLSVERTRRIVDWAEDADIQVRTPTDPERRSGMLCLQFDASEATAQRLVDKDVLVDWRPDCGLRMAPHYYNSEDDVDRFVEEFERAVARTA